MKVKIVSDGTVHGTRVLDTDSGRELLVRDMNIRLRPFEATECEITYEVMDEFDDDATRTCTVVIGEQSGSLSLTGDLPLGVPRYAGDKRGVTRHRSGTNEPRLLKLS